MGLLQSLGLPTPSKSGAARVPESGLAAADVPTAPADVALASPGPGGSPQKAGPAPADAELARWPSKAHRAWKRLRPVRQAAVVVQMASRYGQPFARNFVAAAKSGKTKLEDARFVAALAGQTPDALTAAGYQLAQRAASGDGAQEWWVRADGHELLLLRVLAKGSPRAPAGAPVQRRPDADAPSPAPGDPAKVQITIANESDRNLRFIKADNDGGRFDPAPPAQMAPKQKVSFAALDTGAKGGTLIYQLEAKDAATEEPDQLPWWQMSWKSMAGGRPAQADSTLGPELKGYAASAGAGKGSIAFMLTGASAPTQVAAPQPSQGAGRRRIDVTFANRSDQWLKYWGADRMTVAFGSKPPDALKPGAMASFSIFAQGSGEISFGLMYSIVPSADAEPDVGTPTWTPHFTIPAGTRVLVPGSGIVPGVAGLDSSENPGTDAVSFVLSGKAAATPQRPQTPQPPQKSQAPRKPQAPARPQSAEQRVPITFRNDSNMVLRYWGADKMALTFDRQPPELIKPGQSLGFTVRGKRGSGIDFGLMYSIVANETEKAENGTPKWAPHFSILPDGAMIVACNIHPGMGGLKAGGWPEKDGALFALSGHWAKDQELKTPVSIRNATRYKLRLSQSSAKPGRFDPAAPVEVAPGATATFASWAKAESTQKLVYELEAAEGTAGADSGSAERKRWTLTWQTQPGSRPRPDSRLENIESRGGGWGLDGDAGVRFELEIRDDTDTD